MPLNHHTIELKFLTHLIFFAFAILITSQNILCWLNSLHILTLCFDIKFQQLQLWTSWRGLRVGAPKQPWSSRNWPDHLIQDSLIVLDDPTITKAFVPHGHHRNLDAVYNWPISKLGSRVRCHHKHHIWQSQMQSWHGFKGWESHWVLSKVL